MYKICNLTPIWSFVSTTRTGGSAAGGVSGAGRRSSSTTRPPASPATGAGGLTGTKQVTHHHSGLTGVLIIETFNSKYFHQTFVYYWNLILFGILCKLRLRFFNRAPQYNYTDFTFRLRENSNRKPGAGQSGEHFCYDSRNIWWVILRFLLVIGYILLIVLFGSSRLIGFFFSCYWLISSLSHSFLYSTPEWQINQISEVKFIPM